MKVHVHQSEGWENRDVERLKKTSVLPPLSVMQITNNHRLKGEKK